MLADYPGVDRLMAQPPHTINALGAQYTLFTRVFGGDDSLEMKKKLKKSLKELLAPVERLFLNDAAAAAAIERGGVAQKAASFVSFSEDKRHMKRWELSAGIKVIVADSIEKCQSRGVVEADFQHLVRDFGACFAIPILYGQDFLDRNPLLLDDFWKFDNDAFPLLMIGFPTWTPLKIVKEGVASRSRLHSAIETFYRQIDKYQRDGHVDANLSDVSEIPFDRNVVYARGGWSFDERAKTDIGLLWGQNANTQPAIFWFLTYVYSTPGLLESLRNEVEPYVKLSENKREITAMDLTSLYRNCQLFKSCIFETYRMANEATSIRYIERAVTIEDGEHRHVLKPGTFISAPHALIQRDSSIFPNPDEFVPDRFLVPDESGKKFARYGRLKPWGSPGGMCKGRSFAEKEIMAVGASIMALWDVSPADGTWKLPAMVPGTGLKKPVKDIRVRITPRTF